MALQTAAWTLPSSTRECSYFSAAVTTISTTEIVIYVTFVVDNSEPLTLLSVFDSSLTGECISNLIVTLTNSTFF
jgi:hypothetical protein